MKILRKYFSKDNDKDISVFDKIGLLEAKLGTREGKRTRANIFRKVGNSEDTEDDWQAYRRHNLKRALQIGGGSTAALTALGAATGSSKAALAAAGSGAILTGLGAAGVYVGDRLSKHLARNVAKSEDYRRNYQKTGDMYAVAAGDMTKSEFKKKWGSSPRKDI